MKPLLKQHTTSKTKKINPLNRLKTLLQADEQELAYLLETNPRTIYRWIADGPPDHYGPLARWQGLLESARQTIKEDGIGEWFHEPNRALEGSIPIRLAADPRGFKLVEELLNNAAYGNPL